MIRQILKPISDFLLFTGLYIAFCSVIMVAESYELILKQPIHNYLAGFIFFSTLSSYNFYWFLTFKSEHPSSRLSWSMSHRNYHLILTIIGMLCCLYLLTHLWEHWFWLVSGAALSAMYTAPKINHPLLSWLKKYATGKSILLALIWSYATVVLPVIIERGFISERIIFFLLGRLFFIFSLCVLFDYRDRDDDRDEGIRSLIISLSEKGVDRLFGFSLVVSVLFYFLFFLTGLPVFNLFLLLLPVIILIFLYKPAKKSYSDYLYFFILDGLMMLSGFIWWIIKLF